MKQIEELRISDCCWKLKLDPPVGEMSMLLEQLSLDDCNCIDDISHLRARSLYVSDCQNLTRILIPTATERLHIVNCENVEKLFGGTQMTSLSIESCRKLKWMPERMQQLLPSLKTLILHDCPEIESFPQGGLPFNLQELHITNCKKLVNGRKEWGLQRLSCLNELFIYHDGSDEEIVGGENWELPSSIQTLVIYNLETLSSQHLKSLTSLQYLSIEGNLPQIQSILEQGWLPSSLSELQLSHHHELHLWHLTSLQSLHIRHCHNLQSLSESALPSSLSQLTIRNCPKLQSLPLKGMPSSLSKLSIHYCPLLTPLLEFDKGEYWPEIAHISTIEINWECL